MAIDPSIAAKTGFILWEQRDRISKPYRELRRWLKRNEVSVVVFGAGGVGKTTLGRLLAGDISIGAKPDEYRESFEPEQFWAESSQERGLIVAPGQGFRVDRYWPNLYSQLSKARRAVVVNVVSYGHHSLSAEKTLDDEADAIPVYLEECRSIELALSRELGDYLAKTITPLKMLTLVSKQDLWWPDRDVVKAHYETGEYDSIIQKIRAAKGEQNFAHEYGYVSLQVQNLRTVDRKDIALTAAGYDDTIRVAALERMFEIAGGFIR